MYIRRSVAATTSSSTSSSSSSRASSSSVSSSTSSSATRSAGPESSTTNTSQTSMTSSKGSSRSQSTTGKTVNGGLSRTSSSAQTSSSSSSSSSSTSSSKSTASSSSTKAASTSSPAAQSALSAAPISSPTSKASASVPTSTSTSTTQSSVAPVAATQAPVSASSASVPSQAISVTPPAVSLGGSSTSLASTPTLLATTLGAADGAPGAADTSALIIGTFSGPSGTSSTPNGAATVTPGASQLDSTSGFLQKPGAVVGTFVGVGIVLAAVIAFAICFWRRRHYRKQGTEFSGSVFRWPPSTPAISYSDLPQPLPDSPPPISSFAVDLNRKPSVIWGPRPTSVEDAAMIEDSGLLERGQGPTPPQTAYTPQEPRGVGLARVESRDSAEHDPFRDLYAIQEITTTGLAITTGHPLFRRSVQSYAVSTPSIYSEMTHEDDTSLYEAYSGTEHSGAHLNRNANSTSPYSTASYSPQPPSPIRANAKPMMSEVTRIQGHQMVRSGPSQRF